ncbi:hypothetical protein CP8484711_0066A, partial [Chlamydia psittaci 84-8471/1]
MSLRSCFMNWMFFRVFSFSLIFSRRRSER